MKKIIDMHNIHQLGSHCLTAALRDILEYYGIILTEDICFGLASGYDFVYMRQKDACIFGGRAGNLERNIAEVLGIDLIVSKTSNDKEAWGKAAECIMANHPLIIDVDMAHMPYLVERFQITDNFRFGGHKCILYGFDEDQGIAHVYDYLWTRPLEVSLDNLAKARGSCVEPTPPDNTMEYFIVPERISSLQAAIRIAISKNIQNMLYPVGFGTGLKSLKRFVKEIRLWPEIMPESRLQRELYIAYMSFEKIGTGGGNFRRMFSRFLSQAYEILPMPGLKTISKLFARASVLWKELSHLLKEASENIKSSKKSFFKSNVVQKLLYDILSIEEECVNKLDSEIGRELLC